LHKYQQQHAFMRVLSFEEMMLALQPHEFGPDNRTPREATLFTYPFSIIVEGSHQELDNLEIWIKQNAGSDEFAFLYYEKTGYNFGIGEYFFQTKEYALKATEATPNIYTRYPHSLTSDRAFKSLGYEAEVEYDPADGKAIIVEPPKAS
jgi:hypothetical protein